MDINLTKPIEDFIERQIAKGYADRNEVIRQAFLRWMEEEEFEPDPPRLKEKIAEAKNGKFHSYDPEKYDSLAKSLNEPSR